MTNIKLKLSTSDIIFCIHIEADAFRIRFRVYTPRPGKLKQNNFINMSLSVRKFFALNFSLLFVVVTPKDLHGVITERNKDELFAEVAF